MFQNFIWKAKQLNLADNSMVYVIKLQHKGYFSLSFFNKDLESASQDRIFLSSTLDFQLKGLNQSCLPRYDIEHFLKFVYIINCESLHK